MLNAPASNLSNATCEIVIVPLGDAPAFEAVSYCWGDSTANKLLSIGREYESSLAITQSVYEVLRYLAPLTGKRYLWIDFICSNQADSEEKVHQIPLMRSIYSQAQEVIGILDGEPKGAYIASMFLQDYASRPVNEKLVDDQMFQHDIDSEEIEKREALKMLLANQFFHRRWIVQECILAKDISLIYAGAPLSWTLLNVIKVIPSASLRTAPEEGATPSHTLPATREVLILLQAREDYRSSRRTLVDLAVSFRESKNSVPHDAVYALLGMASEREAACIIPNYRKNIREIYIELVRCGLLVNSFQTFGLINHGDAKRRSVAGELPSWVPDLSRPPAEIYHTAQYHVRGYHAGGVRPVEYNISSDGTQLEIRGVLFDTIKTCCSERDTQITSELLHRISFEPFSSSMIKDLLRWEPKRLAEVRSLVEENLTEPYYQDLSIDEALWRTITEDFDGENHPAHRVMGTLFEVWKMVFAEDTETKVPWDDLSNLTPEKIAELKNADPELKEFYSALSEASLSQSASTYFSSHKFAITEKGYMAMVPSGTESGDVVAVMQGAPAPHILRLNGTSGKCSFWGEGYVHGIMKGEAMSFDKTWFILV